MKISIQENLLPGATLHEKLDCAEELQIDGVEVQGRSKLYDRIAEYEAAFRNRTVRLSSICGQLAFDWLDPDPAKRQESINESKRNLEACGHFGAVGQIVPPIFGPPRLPDLSPLKDAVTLEKELLVEITKELAGFAHSHGTRGGPGRRRRAVLGKARSRLPRVWAGASRQWPAGLQLPPLQGERLAGLGRSDPRGELGRDAMLAGEVRDVRRGAKEAGEPSH